MKELKKLIEDLKKQIFEKGMCPNRRQKDDPAGVLGDCLGP